MRTLPLIAALRNAGDRDRPRLRRLALRKRWTQPQWNQLRALIEKCGGFEYARTSALALAEEARRMLDGEPDNAARRALDTAVDYAVRRDH